MDSDRDNFENLRRCLALKRHEQPPPGYFNTFSRQVIARIRAGESTPQPWWQRWFSDVPAPAVFRGFELKPAFAGMLSFAVCGLITAGILSLETTPSPTAATIHGTAQIVAMPGQWLPDLTNEMLPIVLKDRSPLTPEESTFPFQPAPRMHNLKWTY